MDLPVEHHKKEPPRKEVTPQGLGFLPVVANGKVLEGALNNTQLEDMARVHFPAGCDSDRRRPSFPTNTFNIGAPVKITKSASASEERLQINLSND